MDRPLLDASGQVREPLVLVDLDAGQALPAPTDRIVVGVATMPVSPALAAQLDLTLLPEPHATAAPLVGVADPPAAGAALLAAAEAAPQAALVLAGLLRWTGELAVPAALDAESYAYSTLLGGPEFHRWLRRRGDRPPPTPASAEPVLVERHGDTLTITLNRPERRNAYGREVRDALVAALEFAILDPTVQRAVLTGAGPAFCAGGDLAEFGTTPDLTTAHFVRTRAGAGRLLHTLRDRCEARVHGACVGAGIELPAFAATILAAPDTTFRLPELGMGLIPGAGGIVSLPRRIGRWRTLYLALAGAAIDATTALRWGLVDAITPPS